MYSSATTSALRFRGCEDVSEDMLLWRDALLRGEGGDPAAA